MSQQKPKIIPGEIWSDERGEVKFANNFKFKNIQRFYEVQPSLKDKIRAFHGHFKEEKYVYVVAGSILLCLVKIDDKKIPSKNAEIYKYELSANKPAIVHIPPGYANGFKILEKKSRVIFYSTLSLAQSKKDDFRFDKNYWGDVWST